MLCGTRRYITYHIKQFIKQKNKLTNMHRISCSFLARPVKQRRHEEKTTYWCFWFLFFIYFILFRVGKKVRSLTCYCSVAYLLNHTFSKMLQTNYSLRPIVGFFIAFYRNSGCFGGSSVLPFKNRHTQSNLKMQRLSQEFNNLK